MVNLPQAWIAFWRFESPNVRISMNGELLLIHLTIQSHYTNCFSVWFKLKKLRIATFHSPLQFWIIHSKRHTHLDSNLQNGGHVQCRLVCYNLLVQCLLFLISSTNILGTTGHSCQQITSRMEKCILSRTKFATINLICKISSRWHSVTTIITTAWDKGSLFWPQKAHFVQDSRRFEINKYR